MAGKWKLNPIIYFQFQWVYMKSIHYRMNENKVSNYLLNN